MDRKNGKITIMEAAWFIYLVALYTMSVAFKYNHYAATLWIFTVTALVHNAKISSPRKTRNMILYFAIFSCWILMSFFWSSGFTENQKTIMVSLIEILIAAFCLLDYVNCKERLFSIINVFIWATAAFEVVFYLTSPMSTWGTIEMGTAVSIWRNAAGYYFSFAAVFALYFFMDQGRRKGYLFLAVFLIAGAVGTGSRKIFAHLLLAVLFYVLLQENLGKRLKTMCGIAVVLVIVISVVSQIPAVQELYVGRLLSMFGGLESEDASTVTRALMRQYALELFSQNPVIGAGLDEYRVWIGTKSDFLQRYAINATYSHCNYTELLANNGVIGFVIYYFYPVRHLIKNRKGFRNSITRLGIISVLIFVILDYGTISYYIHFYAFILFVSLLALTFQEWDYDEEGKIQLG